KMTLSSYIDLLRLEDKLREHPFFIRVAELAAGAYLELWDKEIQKLNGETNGNDSSDKLTAAERKKAQRKAQKAEKIASSSVTVTTNAKSTSAESDKKKKDPDPEGLLLIKPDTDLLQESSNRFLKPLMELGSGSIKAWVLAAETYIRKPVKCLKKAQKIDPTEPNLFASKIRFLVEIQKSPSVTPEVSKLTTTENVKIQIVPVNYLSEHVKAAILDSLSDLYPVEIAENIKIPDLQQTVDATKHANLVIKVQKELDGDNVESAIIVFEKSLNFVNTTLKNKIVNWLVAIKFENPSWSKKSLDWKNAVKIVQFLEKSGEDKNAEKFKESCKNAFVLSKCFQ
ncbi:hypothetical protein HK096_010950, partial [Nowakowskiella sp. JEL0078]